MKDILVIGAGRPSGQSHTCTDVSLMSVVLSASQASGAPWPRPDGVQTESYAPSSPCQTQPAAFMPSHAGVPLGGQPCCQPIQRRRIRHRSSQATQVPYFQRREHLDGCAIMMNTRSQVLLFSNNRVKSACSCKIPVGCLHSTGQAGPGSMSKTERPDSSLRAPARINYTLLPCGRTCAKSRYTQLTLGRGEASNTRIDCHGRYHRPWISHKLTRVCFVKQPAQVLYMFHTRAPDAVANAHVVFAAAAAAAAAAAEPLNATTPGVCRSAPPRPSLSPAPRPAPTHEPPPPSAALVRAHCRSRSHSPSAAPGPAPKGRGNA